MRVPQRVHNAVLLMADLAEPSRQEIFVSLTDIAERTAASRGFLEEIVVELKDNGLVEAKRGAYGGYKLARPADEISIGDIVTAVEGPLALVDCLGGSACAAAGSCATKRIWSNVQRHLEDALYAISLADVITGN
ncbi:MAG: Rrf2 family transcriptional regulator [Patescibacteria group bacterium]